MKKAGELKDRAMASSTVLAAAGGSLGALIGALLARKRARSPKGTEGFDREESSETTEQAPVEGAARSAEAKARAAGWYHQKVDQQPLVLALGSMALGMAAAFLFPVTRREHEAVAPLKERLREKLRAQGEQLHGRLEERLGQPAEGRPEKPAEEATPEESSSLSPGADHSAPLPPGIH